MIYILIALFSFFPLIIFSQEIRTTDFSDQIIQYDVSDLWTLTRFQTEFEGDTSTIARREPLGFIGENYQRFFIHFISAIQNPNNKLEYFVYGKTKVKENICSFQGIIKVTSSYLFVESEIPSISQGFIEGDYEFFEDADQKGTGILKGKFKTDFYIDKESNLKYDALSYVADGYKNNQFYGTWTNYKTGTPKKCNWGDNRIPDTVNFDVGVGEFHPLDKYVEFGWVNFQKAYSYSENKQETLEARNKENDKWWLEKK